MSRLSESTPTDSDVGSSRSSPVPVSARTTKQPSARPSRAIGFGHAPSSLAKGMRVVNLSPLSAPLTSCIEAARAVIMKAVDIWSSFTITLPAPQPLTYRRPVFANWSAVLTDAIILANVSTLFSSK
ncbi:hypothetical protein EDB84DRAFT_1564579 [Lactarius hengduanensis]|nr:hypothetical protein EDB84DRAFT_1564579 [Lactarius hengduanensis]